MIALGILAAWLILTAAGFAGLSALRRVGAREDADASSMSVGRPASVLADAHLPIPRVLLR